MTQATRWAGRAVLVAGVALALGMGAALDTSRAEKGEERASSGGSEVDQKRILAKLDQLLAGQAAIQHRLDEMMEELRIVKMRATLRGQQ